MGEVVVNGAVLTCPFGSNPTELKVTSQSKCMVCNKPAATITDIKPGINISGFGLCSSMLNPQVASATAAALGVLTPQPCGFIPAGAWSAEKPKMILAGKPVLCSSSRLICGMGQGMITITAKKKKKAVI